MNRNCNQKKHFGALAKKAVTVCLGIFLFTSPAPSAVAADLVYVSLQSGVTGAQVQKALDSLADRGGVVVLPPGEISLSAPLVLRRDYQTLRGAGAETILRVADGANCPAIIMGEPVNHPQKVLRGLTVANLTIDGNRSHQSRELWKLSGEGSEIRNNGIVVQSVTDSVVEHVTSAHNRSGGLVTTLGVRRLTVRDLNAYDNEFDGLACYETTDSVFTDLSLHDNPGAGISLDLAFNHNVISNAVLVANDLGIFMRASRENQFHNIIIHNSHHYGVFMAHAETISEGMIAPAPQTECTYNSFTNLVAKNCGSAAFRVNDSTCTNNIIINPHFKENHKGGLSLVQPDLLTVQ
jgi:hypothetical protein